MSQAASMPLLRLLRGALRPYDERGQVALEILEHGDLVRVPVPGKRVFFTKSPADFRRVLTENAAGYQKSFDYRILADLVGQGLISSEGELWQRDRRLMQPLFHQKMLAHFVGEISAVAERTAERWGSRERVCVSAEMTRVGLEVIGRRVLGADVSAHAERLAALIGSCQRWLVDRGAAPFDLARWVPTPGRRAFERERAELDGLLEPLISRRWREDDAGRIDVLSLLKAGAVSREAASDHVRTFFAAGYETTAVALTWVCHLLGQHPDWQDRVAAELEQVLGGRAPAFEDLRRLPTLRAVLEESLRLYPAVPLVGREALADDVLSKVPVPKGSTVVLCFLAAQRDGRNFSRPERFDPSRFLPGGTVPPYAHLPFGAGPRSCIGAQFAMLEMSLVVAALLRRYRLRAVADPELKAVPLVSLRPNREVWSTLSPR
ncbi:MAG: cytochrome P450 [Archangiaceae bacterium]|nr:cytochrome P450 [Archangiaceae bacterium]